jgi:hypothetical protein
MLLVLEAVQLLNSPSPPAVNQPWVPRHEASRPVSTRSWCEDRLILADATTALAGRFGVTPGAVSQRLAAEGGR